MNEPSAEDTAPEEEADVQCMHCLVYGYADDKYCACCGTRLRRLCDDCGAIVQQPVAFFCTQCGAKLRSSDDAGAAAHDA